MASRRRDRLGEHSRSRKSYEGPDVVKALVRMSREQSLEGQLDMALATLAKVSDAAVAIYRAAGLPDQLGTYALLDDGAYLPLEIRITSSARLTAVNEMPTNARVLSLASVGEREYGIDSAVGFAARMLESVEMLRERLRAAALRNNRDEVTSINRALWLQDAAQALRLEFVEGPDIAMARALHQSQLSGGVTQGGLNKAKADKRRRAWQEVAIELWRINPKLSVNSMAARLAAHFDGHPKFAAKPDTIRKAIKKPDRVQSTAPTG